MQNQTPVSGLTTRRRLPIVPSLWASLFLAVSQAAAQGQIDFDGNNLTATTANIVAEFRGGDLVRLTNRRTHEQYCHSTTTPFSLVEMEAMEPGQAPLVCTGWRRGNANQLIAFTTFEGGGRSVSMNLAIDPETQDLGVTVWAQSNRPGVRGVQWAIRNLDLTMGRLILPAFGGRYADTASFPPSLDLSYPGDLQAQMTVFEGKRGGFVLYSRDDRNRFGRIRLMRRGGYADMAVFREADAPWEKADLLRPMEWRINAYEGDWRVPAAGYRNLMRFLRPPPKAPVSRQWVPSIRAVVAVGERGHDSGLLARLAERLKPEETLLVLRPMPGSFGRDGPSSVLRALAEAARSRGFRVALHTPLPALPAGEPAAKELARWRVLDPATSRPPELRGSLALFNPASKTVRDRLIALLRPWIESLKPDAVYLSAAGKGWNDASGAALSQSFLEGTVAFHRALLTAFPGVVIGADGVTEATQSYVSLAETATDSPLPPHPICHFLFGDQAALHGRLEGLGPDEYPGLSAWEAESTEAHGVLPTIRIRSETDLDLPGAKRFFRVATAWQANDLAPDWVQPWGDALFQWAGQAGAIARLTRTSTSSRLSLGSDTLTLRVRGTDRVVTGRLPAGWAAFSETGVLGIDPGRSYWLDPPGAVPAVSISALDAGVVVRASSVTKGYALFQLEQPEILVSNLSRASSSPKTGTRFGALDRPARDGARVEFRDVALGGSSAPCVVMRAPYSGGKTGETFAEYEVVLPREVEPRFEFGAGMAEPASAAGSFSVAVNDAVVWKERIAASGLKQGTISLKGWLGRTIKLRLGFQVAPEDEPSVTEGFWASPRVIAGAQRRKANLRLVLPDGARLLAPAASVADRPGAIEADLPAAVVVAIGPPLRAEEALDLLAGPFEATVSADGYPARSFSRAEMSEATVGGLRKARAASAEIAGGQEAALSWVVTLPKELPRKLRFSAGLPDGTIMSGLALEARVNGRSVWRAVPEPGRWLAAEADLAFVAGSEVLVQLVAVGAGGIEPQKVYWAEARIESR